VQSENERQAAIDIVTAIAPDRRIEDNLEIMSVLPEAIGDLTLSEAAVGDFTAATPETSDTESLEPGDFTDQEILTNPFGAAGPAGTAVDEDISEGEQVYVPPTDPVRTRDNEVLGGFQTTSDDSIEVDKAVSGGFADEAIADAVRQELREDAATTDLDVFVNVRQGIVHLRGVVPNLVDAENAEDVAGRVPGVREVREDLEVQDLS
jgi:hypothetical protein